MKIKGCPFPSCGSSDVELGDHNGRLYWIFCNGCESSGPEEDTPEAATEGWNAAPRIHSPELRDLVALEANGIAIGLKIKAIGGHAPGQVGVIQTITLEQGDTPWAQVRFLHLLLAYPLSGLEPLECLKR